MRFLQRWAVVCSFLAGMHAAPLCAQAGVPAVTPAVYVVQITPPSEYQRWYVAMERCTGLRGDFARVEWFITPGPWQGVGGVTYGLWRPPHRILLNAPEAMDSVLVSHEALHDILSHHALQSADVPHPFPWFAANGCAKEYHE